MNGMDGTNASGESFYKGSIDNSSSHLYGAPNIACLSIQTAYQDTANGRVDLSFILQPTAATDNLDAMRYAKIDFWSGTTSSASLLFTKYIMMPDRLYANTTDSNTANASATSCHLEHTSNPGGLSSNNPRLYPLVTLYNVYGPSAQAWFIPPSAINTNWTQQTACPGSWASGGGSGGGGGARGLCPAPYTLIDTVNGQVMAKDIKVGMVVNTLHENTLDTYSNYTVEAVSTGFNDIWTLTMEDGRSLDFAANHRFLTDFAWLELQVLQPGMQLLGSNPGVVKAVAFKKADAEVVKITIADAHTYQSSGLVSHNAKNLTP